MNARLAEAPASVRLSLEHAERLDIAMQQNAVPLVRALRVHNTGPDVLEDLELAVWLEPGFEAARWSGLVERLEPGAVWHVDAVDLPLPAQHLLEIDAPCEARLVARWRCAAGEGLESALVQIDPVERWSMLGLVPELLAAYVLPGDAAVARVLDAALAGLAQTSPPEPSSAGPVAPSALVDALAATLAGLGVAAEPEPLRYDARDHDLVLRLPARVLEQRRATSLDLALLAAGCLERAGVSPLVVVLRERVLLGWWCVARSFAEPALSEPVRLRRRIEIEELELVDLAAMVTGGATPEAARAAALRMLRPGESHLVYAIDVHCARNFRVRPLTGALPAPAAPDAAPVAAPDAPAPPQPGADRLASWKASLLDLSLRNRLLNFRESKRAVPIAAADLAALEDRLAAGGRLELAPRVEVMGERDPRSAAVYAARTGRDPHLELLEAALADGRLHTTLDEAELARRLPVLAREARTSLEESGANTLYLALGLLRWTETPSAATTRLAPLLLVPVELARRSRRDPWTLVALDEDTRVNVTLLEKLRREHGVELPELAGELPTDEQGVDVAAVLRAVRRAIVELERWEVLDEAHLGFFAFTRFLMWLDLEQRSDKLVQNHAVHRLVHGPGEAAALGLTDQLPAVLPGPEWIDGHFAPGELYCPLDSDSSQLAAVVAAHQGASFVLEGPPGTGKSQTITNLVAHCLTAGRTVLFVSEKMAALEVVRERLERIGLGPFCLELHSHKARKSEVIESLQQALDAARIEPPHDWDARSDALVERRVALDAYVDAIHAPTPFGLTVFQVVARLAVLRDTPRLAGLAASPDAHEALHERLAELAAAVTALGGEPCAYPFAALADTTWSAARQRELDARAAALVEPAARFASAWTAAHAGLELGALCAAAPDDDGALEPALALLQLLVEAPAEAPPAALDPATRAEALALFDEVLEVIAAREALRSELAGGDLEDRRRHAVQRALDEAWRDFPASEQPGSVGVGLPEPIGSALEAVRAAVARLDAVSAAEPALLGGVGLDALPASALALVERLLDHAAHAPGQPPLALLAAADWPATRARITGWLDDAARQAALQASLEARFAPTLYELELERLHARYLRWATSFALLAWIMLFGARRELGRIARSGLGAAPEVRDALRDALEVRRLTRALPAEAGPQRELLGALWQGPRTERTDVDALLAWADEHHALLTGVLEPLAEAERTAAREALAARLHGGLRHTALGRWRDELGAARAALGEASDALAHALGLEPRALAGERAAWAARLRALCGVLADDVARFEALAAIEDRLAALDADAGPCLLGAWWSGLTAAREPDAAARARRAWLGELHGRLTALGGPGAALSAPLLALALAQDTPALRELASAPGHALGEVRAARARLYAELGLEPPAAAPLVADAGALREAAAPLVADAVSLREAAARLRSWCALSELWRRAADDGLGTLVEAHRTGRIATAALRDVLDASLMEPWLEQALAEHPQLAGFRGAEHSRRAADFARRDAELVALAAQMTRATLARRLPVADGADASAASELGILQRELRKKRRHLPVRQLFQQIPNLVQRLKPCVMMSPLSVAQYLDADPRLFDLVVFDEASQIPVPDAIGAMARGKQVIVVGDTKQLPPTSFFGKTGGASDEELEDEADFVELDSVLDECVAAALPRLRLGWHYRSRHEHLIAFSNAHYYDNRLLTFPNAAPGAPGLGVVLHRVADGLYDRGGKRHNLPEARAVVDEVVRRLRDPAERARSIGIVTFSIPQQALIEELLDAARGADAELDAAFSAGTADGERLFVKNLENVQGDERDVIIFSICYGPDRDGQIAMNFGPLNRDGGERRLNVAVTRAREQLVVFSTLEPSHIDLSRTRAVGVAHLKRFLEFARGGPGALAEHLPAPAAGADERVLLDDLAAALAERGWRAELGVGCSGFRVDLAVEDPRRPGHFVLGVLLDGASYRDAATARDRERLRPAVLAHLGWRLERVYALDLLLTREQELARLEAACRAALAGEARVVPTAPGSVAEADLDGGQRAVATPLPDAAPLAPRASAAPSKGVAAAAAGAAASVEPAAGVARAAVAESAAGDAVAALGGAVAPASTVPEGVHAAVQVAQASDGIHEAVLEAVALEPVASASAESFFEAASLETVRAQLALVVAQEAPLSVADAARRLAAAWGVPRATKKVREHLLSALIEAPQPVARVVDGFLWAPVQDPAAYRAVRAPAAGEKARAIEDIPAVEQRNAARLALERGVALPRAELVREAARLLGYVRAGERVQAALDAAVEALIAEGTARADGDKVASTGA